MRQLYSYTLLILSFPRTARERIAHYALRCPKRRGATREWVPTQSMGTGCRMRHFFDPSNASTLQGNPIFGGNLGMVLFLGLSTTTLKDCRSF